MTAITSPVVPGLPATPTASAPIGVAVDGAQVLETLFAKLVSGPAKGTADEVVTDEPRTLTAEAVALLLAGIASPFTSAGCATAPPPRQPAVGDPALPPSDPALAARDPARALEALLGDLLSSESPRDDTAKTHPAGQDASPAKPTVSELAAAAALAPPRLATAVATPESAARPTAILHAHPGTHAWSQELAGHIAWIARDDLQSASMRLTPEHLGPLDVRISVKDGDATVSFAASHADTRAALEQAMPRLRELLAAEGLTLAGASVSEHTSRRDPPAPPARPPGFVTDETDVVQEGAVRLPAGLVDLYA